MQKKAKHFTFLYSRTTNNTIKIRRVRVSKKILQNGLLGIALVAGISTFASGVYGVLSSSDLSSVDMAMTTAAPLRDKVQNAPVQPASIDYSRPAASNELARNSGGPSIGELSEEDAEIENLLKVIETTINPANLPTIWAATGKINNEFGFRRNPFGGRAYEFHAGMDIDGERGDSVMAPGNAVVLEAGWKGGYGNMIELDHGNGLTTRYGHLSKIDVSAGDEVVRGQLIGYVGSTGRSTGPHLHYELRVNDKPVNPRRFLPQEPTEIKK